MAGRRLVWVILTAVSCCLATPALASRSAGPSEATYRKLCRSIKLAHVRPLFAGPVAPIQLGGSSDCAFVSKRAGGADPVKVFLRIDDGDQMLWKHLGDRPYGTFRALSGAGQHAKFGYEGGRLPSVVDARTGAFTCTVIPTAGATTYPHLPGSPLAAARAYAMRLLALCGDVFAAPR